MAQRVAIFWDSQTCQLPGRLTGYEAVDNIRRLANTYGSVTVFSLYMDAAEDPTCQHPSPNLQSELELCGVFLTPCSKADSNLPTILSTDMVIFAVDNPPPATIVLISGNTTFTYPVSLLRRRGYRVVLLAPSANTMRGALGMQASVAFDWENYILDTKDSRQTPREGLDNAGDNKAGSSLLRPTPTAVSKSESRRNTHENDNTSSTRPSEVALNWRSSAYMHPQSPSKSRLSLNPDQRDNTENTYNVRQVRKQPPSPLADKTRNPNLPMPAKSPSQLLRRPSPLPELANIRPYKSYYRKDWSGSDDRLSGSSMLGSRSPHAPKPLASPLSSTLPLSTSRERLPGNAPQEHIAPNLGYNYDSPDRNIFAELPATYPQKSYSLARSNLGPDGSLGLSTRLHLPESSHQVAQSTSGSSRHKDAPTRLPSRDAFTPLIEALRLLHQEGNTLPLRSLVGTRLPKAVYHQAGVADFSQYVSLAEREGIIQLGGSMGKSWITLHPALA
ncbi:hypothetical protein D9615_001823 [Tricholomella constricta]|uniref:NYN domain-containing protein n=1 Tax=Tricholomella constricta TaxID=117010 RepID=A0A8H5HPU8_9AGAR|nr:hypothetical protein D9615_001823 [Tricholomella constricta]